MPIVVDVIGVLLTNFLEFIGQTLTEIQKQVVCEKIIEQYPNYIPETIRLCFDRISSGRYGPIYGQVSGMVIMEFFKKFDLELDEEIVVIRQKESNENKNKPGTFESILNLTTDDEKKAEAFRKMKADLLQIGKEKEVKKVNTIKYNAPGGIIQDWMREWDELYKRTGVPSHQVKTVEYKEIRLTQLEFLDMKQKEFEQV